MQLSCLLFVLLGQCSQIWAETPSPWKATLIPSLFSEGQGKLFLVVTLEKGWKFYAPAATEDSLQYTPQLTWKGSSNLKLVQDFWPEGRSVANDGLTGHVYTNAVIVPLNVQSHKPDQPVILKGILTGLACSETSCNPVKLSLSFKLPVKVAPSNPQKQIEAILKSALRPDAPKKEGVSLWMIIALGLLGGLILNVMPCVLPVLGIKLMVFAKGQPGGKRGFQSHDLWMTVFGIYATFMIFAVGTLILKSLGETIGWGIHFQNPYFLSTMVVILILLTANTCGFFELAVPAVVQSHASLKRFHRWKPFFSGVLSVLLATPCAAPFVGTAVGFALARQSFDIFSVFSALAIGFSSPYWVTALLPSHKLPLPKSGPWIEIFQKSLSVLLLATVGWLVFLLSSGRSESYLGLLCVLLGLTLFCFYGIHRGRLWLRFVLFPTLILLLGAPMLPTPWESTSQTLKTSSVQWQPFIPESIPRLVAEGKIVFVDLTASWCLTCHMNKQLVLSQPSAEALLLDVQVVPMRGDWTHANPLISDFLKEFERAGIPFNAVFGPGAPEGLILPEILSLEDVRSAIQKARGNQP